MENGPQKRNGVGGIFLPLSWTSIFTFRDRIYKSQFIQPSRLQCYGNLDFPDPPSSVKTVQFEPGHRSPLRLMWEGTPHDRFSKLFYFVLNSSWRDIQRGKATNISSDSIKLFATVSSPPLIFSRSLVTRGVDTYSPFRSPSLLDYMTIPHENRCVPYH